MGSIPTGAIFLLFLKNIIFRGFYSQKVCFSEVYAKKKKKKKKIFLGYYFYIKKTYFIYVNLHNVVSLIFLFYNFEHGHSNIVVEFL